jgi:hypothetical protein
VEYARDSRDKRIVSAKSASRRRFYTCPRPGCGGRVYLPSVSKQRPHFRHFPGEGTPECDQYYPGAGGAQGQAPTVLAVEESPTELGLLLVEHDGRWGLTLRLPEIPSVELGFTSLSILRSAHVKICAGTEQISRVSALDLRPGVKATHVNVVPTLQPFRTEPVGTWPSTIDKGHWNLESREIDAKGTLFRLRRGEWTRLLPNSGVVLGETLLILLEERCAIPSSVVTFPHARLAGGGLNWAIVEARIPNVAEARLTAWLELLGHEIVPRPWTVELATPPRMQTEMGKPIFWTGDAPVLALSAPQSGAETMIEIRAGSNSHCESVRASDSSMTYLAIKSQEDGLSRLGVNAEQTANVDVAFVHRPTGAELLSVLKQTARVHVWIGAQLLEAWQGTTHKVHVDPRKPEDVRLDLGHEKARVRITVWEEGKQRSWGGLDARNASKILEAALLTASLIELEAENLGRVEIVPSIVSAQQSLAPVAPERLAWHDYVMGMSSRLEEPKTPVLLRQLRGVTALVSRDVGPVTLIRARLQLRRHREPRGTN